MARPEEGRFPSAGAPGRIPRPVTPELPWQRLAFRWCGLACLLCSVAFLGWVASERGMTALSELLAQAGISLVLVGKFIIFAGLREGEPAPWVLAVTTVLMDLCFAFLLGGSLSALERSQLLGSWLRRSRGKAREVLTRYPGLERMAFFGVVAFVLLPVTGTGAITGSFVARLLGLSRISAVAAIALASVWTAFWFTLLAYLLGANAETLVQSPFVAVSMLSVLVLIGWLLYQRVLRKLKS